MNLPSILARIGRRSNCYSAHLAAKARAYDPHKPLDEDFARHFGFTYTPILEDDGRLDDLEAAPVDAIGHLHLESVALRLDGIQVDVLKDAAPVAAIPGSAVVNGEPQHETCEDIAATADEAPE